MDYIIFQRYIYIIFKTCYKKDTFYNILKEDINRGYLFKKSNNDTPTHE